jgi:serine acetyltransferase/dTDP-4-dehydrorhamnose 3,5-epimerase-like enzyme
VLDGAVIGSDCNICDHVFIEDQVVLGDRVTVKCGVQLWNGLVVEDDVFIGPNATFTNDRFPRSRHHLAAIPPTRLCRSASIGAGAIVLPGLTIGQNAMIGAGSVVTSNIQPNAIVTGNPARIVGYIDAKRSNPTALVIRDIADGLPAAADTTVAGVRLHALKRVDDIRGNLSIGEFMRDLPFVPARFFVIFDVPSGRVRGEHALRSCDQILVCVKGSCAVVVDDGTCREEITLDRSDVGIYVPAMTWTTFYKFSADALLLVFASSFYDPEDYIRDYETYLKALHR